ncbi:MAG TPA: glycogen debranching N-terminal domain-containing protein [Ktedonobacteraceae bacterium]|jgi:glycogen debranching enzyme
MPVEIKVGPPVITISQGRTFVVSDLLGGVGPETAQGVYMNDTRFVCYYGLSLNGHALTLVNSSQITFYAARYHLTNPQIPLESGVLAAQTLHIVLNRTVNGGIHEDLSVANYTGKQVHFVLELTLHADFADVFEVRTGHIVRRGEMLTSWDTREKRLRTSYQHDDFRRALSYCIQDDVPVSYSNGRICFSIDLQPNQRWHTCCAMLPEQDGAGVNGLASAGGGRLSGADAPLEAAAAHAEFRRKQAQWPSRCTGIVTSNNDLQRMYRQAVDDMGALRIYDMDISEDIWVPAAGVPWFVTLFGRDSLIVSYQNMLISPGFARGALKRLAEYQALERDDWRDAQPGKILHELRFGELAHFRQVPFTPYYGTADATILYLIVLSETYRWTGDLALVQEYRQVAQRCLCWIDRYGDLDGDGFQEYKTFSQPGYENLGWKDAFDAVMYADGTQVPQPKALCELQGYVYDARMRLAELFEALGDQPQAAEQLAQAQLLKQRFNEHFWVESEGCYAFGLDGAKKQITSIASNAGQCLWSGIADPEKAARTASRLLKDDMWNGWGIRTLSARNPAYNPLSYHCGSIWPHDNGIIAEGFKRYGLIAQTQQVIRGVFDAVEHFEAYRPPEVFAGVQREGPFDFPVLYPGGANIPQAWATGSIFHMLRTLLGLRADAPHGVLYVRPTLPAWLPDIDLQRLRVGGCLLDLHFWRDGQGNSQWRVQGVRAEKKEDLIEVRADPGEQGS